MCGNGNPPGTSSFAKLAAVLLLLSGISTAAAPGARHYSIYPDSPDVFLEALERNPCSGGLPGLPRLTGGITTHHFLANRQMVEYFETISASGLPDLIILLGPDHFVKHSGVVSISRLPWFTPLGVVEPDPDAAGRIERGAGLNASDESRFFGEHSMGALMPMVRAFIPGVRVVPIIIGWGVPQWKLDKLAGAIRGEIERGKVHVLLSMDFSHGKPHKKAVANDLKTKAAIMAGNAGAVPGLEVDSPGGLYLLMKLFSLEEPIFGSRTDSAELSGKDLSSCTSYMNVYYRMRIGRAESLSGRD